MAHSSPMSSATLLNGRVSISGCGAGTKPGGSGPASVAKPGGAGAGSAYTGFSNP